MISVAKLDDVIKNMGKRTGYELIGEKDGCVNGCRCGVSVYTREEYDLMRERMMTRRASSSLRGAEGRWSGMMRLC